MDTILLYNTMSRKKEEFKPIDKNKVGIYTCGPTVYNFAHIGNLRTFIFEDVLKKTLALAGYNVFHVMNITDVGHLSDDGDDGEDKVLREANKEKKTINEIVDFYTNQFLFDIDALNIKRADVLPRASEHVKEMLDIIKRLEKNGHTYIANGNVYYSIDTFKNYGELAKLKLEDLQEGKRVGIDKSKKNPHDFVLWFTKSKFENQAMKWDSEYGTGYPGWHLECSAMSMKYLGETFDIHCGGVDAIPIHHTNEIAQSEGATGKKMANYWMHGEFLLSEKGKMSKSTGGFITLNNIVQDGILPLAYRYFCLQSHYKKQLQYSHSALKGADTSLRSLYKKISLINEEANKENYKIDNSKLKPYRDEFKKALYNDLNTSVAVAVLHNMLSAKDLNPSERMDFVKFADSVLSLSLIDNKQNFKKEVDIPQDVIDLAQKRLDCKKNKDYKAADEIRSTILQKGYVVKDTPSGFEIEKA